jgi:uncharacterized protein (TIGR02145 family)
MKKIILLASVFFTVIACKKEENTNTPASATTNSETVKDVDGNSYKTVKIGNQTWMAENLRVSKYNDGTSIPVVTDKKAWEALKTPAMSEYDNSSSNGATYGKMYNFYTVSTNKVCPTGWHVPSDQEWLTMINFLGGDSIAGNKMKAIDNTLWTNLSSNSTNSSGFSGLPGGNRWADGVFDGLTRHTTWQTSTEADSTSSFGRYIGNSSANVGRSWTSKRYGLYIRCLKD